MEKTFHEQLKTLMDGYVHGVYRVTKKFPKDELYGSVSQLRRAALSVVLNYIEGYARRRSAVLKNFLEISYGSLQESKYLLTFAFEEKYLVKEDHDELMRSAERIGKMLWGTLNGL